MTLVVSTPEAFPCCLCLLHTQQPEHLPRASQHERPKICLAVAPSVQSLCCTPASQSSLALSPRKLPFLTTLLLFCPSLLMPSLDKHFCQTFLFRVFYSPPPQGEHLPFQETSTKQILLLLLSFHLLFVFITSGATYSTNSAVSD